ncbi:hypothetical protein SAMN05216169_10864 [Anoxybacillus pushchinoensis]|uniref:Uncharacterized protein n=1 Tax=Anoxybacillus pushchinoensis TaxID=150248 RepID=A0A1I0U4Y3_9BACL|nr:hypothetical protein SAMN05216169_10864 [Anoxybacillus pushchinoensis]
MADQIYDITREDTELAADIRRKTNIKMEQNGCKTTVLQPFCQQSERHAQRCVWPSFKKSMLFFVYSDIHSHIYEDTDIESNYCVNIKK